MKWCQDLERKKAWGVIWYKNNLDFLKKFLQYVSVVNVACILVDETQMWWLEVHVYAVQKKMSQGYNLRLAVVNEYQILG